MRRGDRETGRRGDRGLTLMEVLIAISLLGLLAVGVLTAMHVALNALGKVNAKLIDNRRVAGTQRILEDELEGFMPVMALCGATPGPQGPKTRMPFFEGQPRAMRFVSTYSLQAAWRGLPQILEFLVIPREDGQGVRLIVNEHVYTGPLGAGAFCMGFAFDPAAGGMVTRFAPIAPGPRSFVLADNLAECRFTYLAPAQPPLPEQWRPGWNLPRWPRAVRVEMAPFAEDFSRLRPMTITAPLRVNRSPDIEYVDE